MAAENAVDAAVERILVAVREERRRIPADEALDYYRELLLALREDALQLRNAGVNGG